MSGGLCRLAKEKNASVDIENQCPTNEMKSLIQSDLTAFPIAESKLDPGDNDLLILALCSKACFSETISKSCDERIRAYRFGGLQNFVN